MIPQAFFFKCHEKSVNDSNKIMTVSQKSSTGKKKS